MGDHESQIQADYERLYGQPLADPIHEPTPCNQPSTDASVQTSRADPDAIQKAFGHYTDPPQPQSMDIPWTSPMYDLQMEREKQEWARMKAEADAAAVPPEAPHIKVIDFNSQQPQTAYPPTDAQREQWAEEKRLDEEVENCKTLPSEGQAECMRIYGPGPSIRPKKLPSMRPYEPVPETAID